MPSVKYLLIGGGLASAEAAKQIRRVDAEGSIALVSDEPLLPYNRPPLSKEYLRGEATDPWSSPPPRTMRSCASRRCSARR